MPRATWRGREGEWRGGEGDGEGEAEGEADTGGVCLGWDADGGKVAYGVRDQVCYLWFFLVFTG